MDHLLEPAGRVGSVLSGQTPVLLVDELQLGESLMDLPLEGLLHTYIMSPKAGGDPNVAGGNQ